MQLILNDVDVNIQTVEQLIVYGANALSSQVVGGFKVYNEKGVEVAYPWITRGIVDGGSIEYLGLEVYFPLKTDYLYSKRYPHLHIDHIPLLNGVPNFPNDFKTSVLNAV